MFKFSCFSHIQSHKNKRTFPPLVKELQKTSQDCTQKKAPTLLHLEENREGNTFVSIPHPTIRGCKSEEMNTESDRDSRCDSHEAIIKKSHSLGCELDQEGRASCKNTVDPLDKGYLDAHSSEGNEVSFGVTNEAAFLRESIRVGSDMANIDAIISTVDTENRDDRSQKSLPFNGYASKLNSRDPTALTKSYSMPEIGAASKSSSNYRRFHACSSKDISLVGITEGDSYIRVLETADCSHNNKGISVMPVMETADEVINPTRTCRGESSGVMGGLLPNDDFKKKRIKEWIMGLQNFSPSEEMEKSSLDCGDSSQDRNITATLSMARNDTENDAVKKYISCLSAAATTSQFSNNGLVLIPFMNTFSSLKVLNLSGNAIVRITAGALPHGLHVLNLSKNNISMIEGLRELNRLRILDLSYNRIFRIGHGLASCSSMKELYLAGNKISEVEGLHRLLKLNVLDLRFNKISTSRCLGQLAANYISLQAISLEGNPAQKNVGDDQIRKQLHDLLPHLVYYNRQPIKASVLKDTAADRPTRTASIPYHLDRTLRLEKHSRKNAHGFPALKLSFHEHKNLAAANNASRSRHKHVHRHNGTIRIPSKQRNTQNFELGGTTAVLGADFFIRRSQSEGTLGTM